MADRPAGPSRRFQADLVAPLRPSSTSRCTHGGPDSSFTLEVATNWKLAVENYCESYHLPWVHPGLNSYSRLEDHYHIEAPGRYSGQGSYVYRQLRGTMEETFPDFPGLSEKWDTGAEYVALYPNVLLGVHRDHAYAIILEAVAHNLTREHVHIYYASPSTDETLRAKNATQWKSVFVEDIFVVEGMQRGRFAAGFDGGRFSPAMDGPTHIFHAWVAAHTSAMEAKGRREPPAAVPAQPSLRGGPAAGTDSPERAAHRRALLVAHARDRTSADTLLCPSTETAEGVPSRPSTA